MSEEIKLLSRNPAHFIRQESFFIFEFEVYLGMTHTVWVIIYDERTNVARKLDQVNQLV